MKSIMTVNERGDKVWHNEKGQRHREDGPAVEYANGDRVWYLNGRLHREDGPAMECENGDKSWYLNGQCHREDGPAIESDGDKHWYLNGKEFSEADFLKQKSIMKSTMTVNQYGTKKWRNEKGEYHREDGPAIEYADGGKVWYLNGKLHREDGPAVEYADGDKSWYLNGQLHREDGPAIEYANGYKAWYLNGKKYSEVDFIKIVGKSIIENKISNNGDISFLLACFGIGSLLQVYSKQIHSLNQRDINVSRME